MPIASGWGPMQGLFPVTEALPDTCLGACFVQASDGTFKTLAATATAIYELDTSNLTWTDISGASGPYSASDRWTFTQFGDKVYIHQINDPIQVYDIEVGGVVVDAPGSPPRAKYSWIAGDFLVLGNLENAPTTVQWSGVNNAEEWDATEGGADSQYLPEGGEILAGFGDRGGFYVVQRYGMQYFSFALSTGYTFARTVINPTQGSISARSVVNIGNGRFFFLSEDGFFANADRTPIGAERVDRWFFEQVGANYLLDIQGSADPYKKIIWWTYRAAGASRYMIGYNWQLDRWCRSDLIVGDIIPLVTLGMSWDSLDEYYASIAEVSTAYDSRLFLGDRPTLATFDSDNRLSFLAGSNLEAVLETAVIQFDANNRASINEARVTTDAATYTVTDTTFDFHGSEGSESPPSSPNRAGLVPLRSDGRLHKFTTTIPEGTTWTVASDVEVNPQVSGKQ
jgi:hypothetical protein